MTSWSAHRAGRGLGIGGEALVVDPGHAIATEAKEHLGELRAEHQLVGVAADVAFEVSRCAGPVAAFQALGGQCEGVGFGSRFQMRVSVID